MFSRSIRVLALLAIISMASAMVFAADPWNTGSIWGRPSMSAGASNTPRSVISPMQTVGAVSSPNAVPSVNIGVIPPDNSIPAAKPSGALLKTSGVPITGDPSAGAHLVMMKCAGCHGQDGSGHGSQLDEIGGHKPISWTNKAQMSQMSDQEIASRITTTNNQQDSGARMPAFRDLSGKDINDIVAYIRSIGQD